MAELLLKEESYRINGCGIEVHRELGHGFLEPVYQEAMEIELAAKNIPFQAQPPLKINYKGHELKKEYKPDLICFGKVLVELKAISCLTGKEESQVLNYLKATGLRVGLLLNFGSHGQLERKRLVL